MKGVVGKAKVLEEGQTALARCGQELDTARAEL
jgi:hypothetical protein